MDIEDIKRIEFRPGDKLVVRVPGMLSEEQALQVKTLFEEFAPGIPVAVLCNGMTLDILSEVK